MFGDMLVDDDAENGLFDEVPPIVSSPKSSKKIESSDDSFPSSSLSWLILDAKYSDR